IIPKSARLDIELPRITPARHIVGLVAGGVIMVLFIAGAVTTNAPQEPYGVRQRVWDRYDEARKAEIAAQATADFNNVEFPFLIALNLFPAALVYFAVREVSGVVLGSRTNTPGLTMTPAR